MAKNEVSCGYLRLLLRLAVLALICFLIFTQVFLITRAEGNEMFPAIKDGDLIIAFRMQREYIKNDIAVCTPEGRKYIGRIAAIEHDTVTLDESGTLLVNGTPQSGEAFYQTYAKDGITYPFTVPDGCVFILGDNRPAAHDSRELGAVSTQDIEGKVITLLRRRGL